MRVRPLPVVGVTLLLAGLAALAAVQVAWHFPSARVELCRARRVTLSGALEKRLETLRDDVLITYYVTAREKMPSHMRRVEREVVELLASMRLAAKGRLDFHVVDPTDDHDLAGFAAKRGVSPVRERHLERDAYSEQKLWSTITVAYGPRAPALIQGVGPNHLPRLQEILRQQLDQLETPRRPVFALAAGAGFLRLADFLELQGDLLRVDPGGPEGLPAEADVLFWMNPGRVDATLLRNLRHFIDSGRSVVIAGSLQEAELVTAGRPALKLTPSGYDAEALMSPFGLFPVPGLVLDAKSAALKLPTGEAPAPFRVACLTLNQDFHAMSRDPRGTLLLVAPTPIGFDSERLSAEGWKAEVLATSSDETSILPVFEQPMPLERIAAAEGEQVPKQALLVWLRHAEAWRGSVVFAASSGLFRDETFDIQTLGHKRLAEALIETLASDERLVMARSDVSRPKPLPVMSPARRLLWRLSSVFLLPALLLCWMLARSRVWRRRDSVRQERRWRLRVALCSAAALLLVLGGASLASLPGLRVDLTRDGVNELAPHSRELAARAVGARAVVAELLFSEESRLPPELKPLPGRARNLLRQFARAGADLTLIRTVPEDLDQEARQRLADDGVAPFPFASRSEEVTTVRTVFSALRLSAGGRTELLPLKEPAAAENLEFRVAFALHRLQTGRPVRIAFASDAPRLSSAEAYQYYQSKGLIPPSGKDVYSLARGVLSGCDFDVTHVNPRDPVLPPQVDLLIWLQPRRSVTRMLEVVVEHLYRGGKALLAAQHFNIQSRQYRGKEFEFVYWPQPQSPDMESFYFPDLGVKLVREVLFDNLSMKLELESQVNRFSRREFRSMNLAKPFLIRAAGRNFSTESPITRGLGDQPFLFANYFELDPSRLSAVGLKATPLITTSDKSWSLDWRGGWIPEGYQHFPPVAVDPDAPDQPGEPVPLLGRVPLAVMLEGMFPWPKQAFEHPALRFGAGGALPESEEVPDYPREEPVALHRPGRLLMLGCSELFKDHRLTSLAPEFRADHLLLNAAADLALDPGLASIMSRRAVTRGFEPIGPERTTFWRLVALLTLPALLLFVWLIRFLFLRRPLLRLREG
ncbi:MAG: Gldg family protein [Planctomycetota bacterium]